MLNHTEPHLTTLASDHGGHRRPVARPGAVPGLRIGPSPGRIERIGVRHPFLPRVLVHLIGLHHRIIQRQRIGGLTSLLLELMTPLEQVRTVPPQFTGELAVGTP